jgi:hypothetical protein
MDLSRSLEALGIPCQLCTDVSYRSINEALKDFTSELSEAEAGLFFFAGRGISLPRLRPRINRDFGFIIIIIDTLIVVGFRHVEPWRFATGALPAMSVPM